MSISGFGGGPAFGKGPYTPERLRNSPRLAKAAKELRLNALRDTPAGDSRYSERQRLYREACEADRHHTASQNHINTTNGQRSWFA